MGGFLRGLFIGLPAALLDAGVKLRALSEPLGLAFLILLGLHGAADLLDDILFVAVDLLDRGADSLMTALLAWLGESGILKPQTAAGWSDSFALLLDIDRKEAAAVLLALAAELFIGLALIWWCLPGGGGAQETTTASTAAAENAAAHQRALAKIRAALAALRRWAPGGLRAVALVLAFGLGAFAIGRWAAGYVALWVSGPVFGPEAGLLAKLGGVLAAAAALLVLVPVALRRARARTQALMWSGVLRSLAWPLLVAALLLSALVSGAPGQALRQLIGGGA